MVGRAGEREALDLLLDGARNGTGGALVLRGEPGIGKTTLLQYARGAADDMRIRLLAAESRAGQRKYFDIELAVAHLHGMLEMVGTGVSS
jgi:predicted ATP-dependent serine protease